MIKVGVVPRAQYGRSLNLVRVVGQSLLWGAITRRTTCSAHVCTQCGYAEFYADDLQALLKS
jgi:hypothetical protein